MFVSEEKNAIWHFFPSGHLLKSHLHWKWCNDFCILYPHIFLLQTEFFKQTLIPNNLRWNQGTSSFKNLLCWMVSGFQVRKNCPWLFLPLLMDLCWWQRRCIETHWCTIIRTRLPPVIYTCCRLLSHSGRYGGTPRGYIIMFETPFWMWHKFLLHTCWFIKLDHCLRRCQL